MTNCIIHISPCFVDIRGGIGGISNCILQLAKAQAQDGIHSYIFCTNSEGGVFASGIDHVVDGNLSIRIFDQRRLIDSLRSSISQIRQIASLHNVIGIHLHALFNLYSDSLGFFCLSKFGSLVVTPHGRLSRFQLLKKGIRKKVWFGIWKVLTFRKNISYCFFSRQEFGRCSAPKNAFVSFIPNGLEIPIFREASTELRNIKYALYVGRIEPIKQVDFLIESFFKSKSSITHRLVIVGPADGVYALDLKKKYQSLVLSKRLVFPGEIRGDLKWSYISNAKVVVLPSLSEGMPLVLMEALSLSVPSIFSSQSNCSFISDNGAGLEIEDFLAPVWSDVLDSVLLNSNYQLELSSHAKTLSQQFQWNLISRRYIELFESMG